MAKKIIAKPEIQNEPEMAQNIGRIEEAPIVAEMRKSYLEYAMSVIISRALPDVRDGMKPVHRRILYSMWEIGLRANAKFKKSAAVVGEVLGKYHPHGDAAVYMSMVHMAQDFKMRYPLVNGQGNFGSVDGDNPAAHRYTEAKLRLIAEEMMYDIDKNTVNFIPNYDASQKEPTVLPAKLPNLLLNGTVGIAVGMATSIPPHNLGELIDGVVMLIDNPEATVNDLMKVVKGPDFPTGGIIFGRENIKQAYATGKGSIVQRGVATIEEYKASQYRIVITEIPFQVVRSSMIERIAELVHDKKIEGIKDLRDESDKDGNRIVIELKRDAPANKILNQLYKHTQLQETFHVNTLALVDGIEPRVLTLKECLHEFIKHRQNIITRRTQFDLDKTKDRAHILDGLVMALEHIDKIIDTIKKSKDKEEAKLNLIKKFKLSERQAIAILEMRLQQLANLEHIKIEKELEECNKLIKELENILKNKSRVLDIIKEDLVALKEKFGDIRRTKIVDHEIDSFKEEDLIPNEPTMVMLTHEGYIKRMSPDTFKTQYRGGKGVTGVTTKDEDSVQMLFATESLTGLLFFTSKGRVFQLKAHEIPEGSRTAKGSAIVNFLELGSNEKVQSVLELSADQNQKYIIMVTKEGLIKRVELAEFAHVRRNGIIAMKLKGDDELMWARLSSGSDHISLVSAHGIAIRFEEKHVRSMGRTASGVRGMHLKGKDCVVGMDVVPGGKDQHLDLLVVMANGFGKRTSLDEFKTQGRGGSGIKAAQVTDKTGVVRFSTVINSKVPGDAIIVSQKGQVIRLNISTVPELGRATQGVRLMRFKDDGDTIASIAIAETVDENT